MKSSSALKIRPFQPADKADVIALWKICGLVRASNDLAKDIARKLQVRPDLFLVGVIDGRIVATAMLGYEGHRGWINYLAVHPDFQRNGYGRTIMAEAERLLREAGCPKINLQVRSENSAALEFYQAIGFSQDSVMSLGKRLEID